MSDSIVQRVRSANSKLRLLLLHTREALAGRRKFDAEEVHAISEPVRHMDALIEEARLRRGTDPALDRELEAYAGNLNEMQTALEQMRFMLVAHRTHMEAMRGHLETMKLWSDTLRMTR
ncbi:MAG TPA: hypothetical protein VMM16_16095 [Verrucomicrobiae bacterium]|nr:hypothetical protein [Verrucomicrobiae bacterium]